MAKKIIDVWYGTPTIHKYSAYDGGGETVVIKDRLSIDPESSIDSLIKVMSEYKKMAEGDGYADLNFTAIADCGCRYDCSCRPSYYLRGKRLETDLEYEYRKKQEKQQDEARKAREKAEYERLKKQFEGK